MIERLKLNLIHRTLEGNLKWSLCEGFYFAELEQSIGELVVQVNPNLIRLLAIESNDEVSGETLCTDMTELISVIEISNPNLGKFGEYATKFLET